MSCTLYSTPAAFSLASCSCSSLAVDCALRFCQVDYRTELSWKHASPALQVDKGTPLINGVSEVLDFLVTSGRTLNRSLLVSQSAQNRSIAALVGRDGFAAFNFLAFLDPANYRAVAAQLTLFERVACKVSHYKNSVAQEARCFGMGSTDSAAKTLLAVLSTLEDLLTALFSTTPNASFVLGTANPTTSDCYVYALSSAVIHGHFDDSSALSQVQSALESKCPMLHKYVNGIREAYFASYAGSSHLEPRRDAPKPQSPYTEGRTAAVVITLIGTLFYFVVYNADVLLYMMHTPIMDGMQSASAEGAQPDAPKTEAPPAGEQQPVTTQQAAAQQAAGAQQQS